MIVACGLVKVRYGAALGLFDKLEDVVVEDLSDIPQAGAAFEAILAEQSTAGPGSEAMKAALMSQCIVHLLRRLCEGGTCSPLPWLAALEDERLARVLDRILRDPGRLAHGGEACRNGLDEPFGLLTELHKSFRPAPDEHGAQDSMERALGLLERGTNCRWRRWLDEWDSRAGAISRERSRSTSGFPLSRDGPCRAGEFNGYFQMSDQATSSQYLGSGSPFESVALRGALRVDRRDQCSRRYRGGRGGTGPPAQVRQDVFAWRYLCFTCDPGNNEGPEPIGIVVDGYRGRADAVRTDRAGLSRFEGEPWRGRKTRILCGGPMGEALEQLPEHFQKEDIEQSR